MRVAVVSRWYPRAGDEHAGLFVRDQVEVLRRRIDVDVVVPREVSAAAFAAATIHPAEGEIALPPAGPLGRAFRGRAFSRALGRLEPMRLVHVHLLVPDALPVLRWCAPRGIPVVVTEHAAYLSDLLALPRARRQIREVLSRAAAVVAVGTSLRSLLLDAEPSARVEVIGNVIDTEFFVPGRAERRHVASVAPTLDERKGIDLLLRAWQDVDLPLVLVGTDPGGRMRSLAQELAVADRVEFTGPLERDALRAVLQRARLYVCASDTETFGVAVAEALACGVPVVSTRCGGPEDFVDDAVGGLAPLKEPRALAATVRGVLARGGFDSDRLHGRIAARFGPAAFEQRLLALYDDVVG